MTDVKPSNQVRIEYDPSTETLNLYQVDDRGIDSYVAVMSKQVFEQLSPAQARQALGRRVLLSIPPVAQLFSEYVGSEDGSVVATKTSNANRDIVNASAPPFSIKVDDLRTVARKVFDQLEASKEHTQRRTTVTVDVNHFWDVPQDERYAAQLNPYRVFTHKQFGHELNEILRVQNGKQDHSVETLKHLAVVLRSVGEKVS